MKQKKSSLLFGHIPAATLLVGALLTASCSTVSDTPATSTVPSLGAQRDASIIELEAYIPARDPICSLYYTPRGNAEDTYRKLFQEGQYDLLTQSLASAGAFHLIGREDGDIYDPYREAAFNSRKNGSSKSVGFSILNYHIALNMIDANPGVALDDIRYKLQKAFTGPFEKTVPQQLFCAGVDIDTICDMADDTAANLIGNVDESLATVGLRSPYNPAEPTFISKLKKVIGLGQPTPEEAIKGISAH